MRAIALIVVTALILIGIGGHVAGSAAAKLSSVQAERMADIDKL